MIGCEAATVIHGSPGHVIHGSDQIVRRSPYLRLVATRLRMGAFLHQLVRKGNCAFLCYDIANAQNKGCGWLWIVLVDCKKKCGDATQNGATTTR